MFSNIQEQLITQLLRMIGSGFKIDTIALQEVADKLPETMSEFMATKALVEKRIADYDVALLAMNAKLDTILSHLGVKADVRNDHGPDINTDYPDGTRAVVVAGAGSSGTPGERRRFGGSVSGVPVRPARAIADPSGC